MLIVRLYLLARKGGMLVEIDAVFSGGGVKGFAFIGALQSINEHGLTLARITGTSAGAIVASLIASDFHVDEIERMLDHLDLKKFLDPPKITTIFPPIKWFTLFFQMGIYKGNKFEQWLYEQLARKNIYTFNDFKHHQLKIIISDLTLGRLVVMPDDLERLYGIDSKSFPVATAVRISAGFPYFFMPKRLRGKNKRKSIVVDGGLLSNFPLWVFEDENGQKKRPLLGVTLSDSVENAKQHKINHALDMFQALFSTMKQAHDARYISTSKQNNVIFIPVENIQAVDLSIGKQAKERLIRLGREKADHFLQYWPS